MVVGRSSGHPSPFAEPWQGRGRCLQGEPRSPGRTVNQALANQRLTSPCEDGEPTQGRAPSAVGKEQPPVPIPLGLPLWGS